MGQRHLGRKLSFQFLYHSQYKTAVFNPALLTQAFNTFLNSLSLSIEKSVHDFSIELIQGTLEHFNHLELLLEKKSEHWKLNRISKVDHTILLQALYELLFCPQTPTAIVIDEAIELAKEFGSENSGAFVNGILDSVAEEARKKNI